MNLTTTQAIVAGVVILAILVRSFVRSAQEGTNGFVWLWDWAHGRRTRMRVRDINGHEFTYLSRKHSLRYPRLSGATNPRDR